MTDSSTAAQVPSAEDRTLALARIYDLMRLVVAAAIIILAVWLVSEVLVVVFAAALLAVILYGTARLLQRHTPLPYWAALTIVVVVLLAVLIGLGFVAGPGLSEQATQLRSTLAGQWHHLQERLGQSDWGRVVLQQVPTWAGGHKDGAPSVPSGLAGSVVGYINSALGLLGTIAVVLIAALYFAASPFTYVNGALRLVAARHRPKAKLMAQAAGRALWAWSAGQALDMLVVGILSGLGLWTIGVPLALVLGVVAGLLNFVPYIGAITGAIPAVLIAFSVSTAAGLETIALYVVIQAFEGNVMAPMIQKRAVHLPPGLTILAQTAFGAILGIPGLIFATPLTAALLAVMAEATQPLSATDAIDEDPEHH